MNTLLAPPLPVFASLSLAGSSTPAPARPAVLPPALVRPLEALFGATPPAGGENFLAGLQASGLLGAGALPAAARRRAPLAWIGVALRAGRGRLFDELRGGCWVRGFPAVGRGRLLLAAADLAAPPAWGATLRELGVAGAPGTALYFNFHPAGAGDDWERVYALDAERGQLHAFALPAGAAAAPHLGACAAAF